MSSPPIAPFRPAGAATPLIEATAGIASSVVFGLASFVRRARVFHPDGVAFSATIEVEGDGVLRSGRYEGAVRFSRGAGLPESLPDILGLALRLIDAHGPDLHQDLLLVTSGSRPGSRHALVPSRTFGHERWSSILPYEVGDTRRRVVFGARPRSAVLDGARHLDDLRRILPGAGVRFALEVASPAGTWDEIGVVRIGDPLSDAENDGLRFNPANTGGGIHPVGVLQTIRRLAYRGSQRGRPSPD